jgi:hypothetical protein
MSKVVGRGRLPSLRDPNRVLVDLVFGYTQSTTLRNKAPKSDDERSELEQEKLGLEVHLDRIEVKLKDLDVLTKRLGILAAVIGLLVTGLNIGLWVFQLKLMRAQASEQIEKNRVNVAIELAPLFDPENPRKFWVNVKFINHSYRQVKIAMLGIRIWKDWSSETSVGTTPDNLLFAENRINDCAKVTCPLTTSKSRLVQLDHEIIVTPNVQDYVETLGPYQFPVKSARKGFWLEGWAFTKEQDEGDCVIVKPATFEGALPTICQERFASLPGCERKGICKSAYAFARPFVFK